MRVKLLNCVIKFILHILLKVDASELKKVPLQGPLLLAVNHVNAIEVPVMITHLAPRPITGLVKKETWDEPFLAFLFNIWGGIPIDRNGADFAALKEAKVALNDGKILAVAPEGTRSGDGHLVRGKPGIAILASQSDVPILPIAYYGHEDFKSNLRKLKRTHMVIKVGEPFLVNLDGNHKNKQALQATTDAIMLRIAVLMPESYHGVYAHFPNEQENYITDLHGCPGKHIPEAFGEQLSHT